MPLNIVGLMVASHNITVTPQVNGWTDREEGRGATGHRRLAPSPKNESRTMFEMENLGHLQQRMYPLPEKGARETVQILEQNRQGRD